MWVDDERGYRWKTSKTLAQDDGGKPVDLSIKNLQPSGGLVKENRKI